MSVMEYNNYGAYNAYQPYSSYSSYSSQPNHFNLKVGLLYDFLTTLKMLLLWFLIVPMVSALLFDVGINFPLFDEFRPK